MYFAQKVWKNLPEHDDCVDKKKYNVLGCYRLFVVCSHSGTDKLKKGFASTYRNLDAHKVSPHPEDLKTS